TKAPRPMRISGLFLLKGIRDWSRGGGTLAVSQFRPPPLDEEFPMIVVMKKGASNEEIQHMIRQVERLGLKAHPIFGTERTVIAAIGEKRDEHRQSLESGPGVAEVVPILAPYKVASREVKSEPTVIRVGSLTVGNTHVGMIAGPCSVENEEQ